MLGFISSTAFGLAVVLVATAGLFATIGADRIRDALLRGAAGCVVAALGIQVVAASFNQMTTCAPSASGAVNLDPLIIAAVIVGHIALAVFLYRRRVGADRTGFAADIEAARGRERVRLIPPIARGDMP